MGSLITGKFRAFQNGESLMDILVIEEIFYIRDILKELFLFGRKLVDCILNGGDNLRSLSLSLSG